MTKAEIDKEFDGDDFVFGGGDRTAYTFIEYLGEGSDKDAGEADYKFYGIVPTKEAIKILSQMKLYESQNPYGRSHVCVVKQNPNEIKKEKLEGVRNTKESDYEIY